METRYRADYAGEFVITDSKWSGGKKTETREWIPNPIINQHISGRAACIGSAVDHPDSGNDAYGFDYTRLEKHRGGILGSKKLQTYGVGSVAMQMRLDFTVENQQAGLETIQAANYQQDNIVYTTPRNCIRYPGQFYLIPYDPQMINMATIVYLAAFDGHKEIFLLGYTDYVETPHKDWISQIATIFLAYPGATFYLVGEETRMFDDWLAIANVRTMHYREFISYCDC
jgi:hypothetical protein